MSTALVIVVALPTALAIGTQTSAQAQVAQQIRRLADEYVDLRLQYDPTLAAPVGLPSSSQMRLPDRTERALQNLRNHEDALLRKVESVDASGTKDPVYAVLRDELESRRELRVCRSELWDLSQTEGWQIELPALAAIQPVATAEDRKRALNLWSTLPQYLRTDIENLRSGLASGYSVPKSIVGRVLKQLNGLMSASPENSPFYSPAKRAHDAAFAQALRREIADQITPAIKRYAEFLRTEYLPKARESIGLSSLPNGQACYQAYLRRYTTTDEAPELIFSDGKKLVSESTREIQSIGSRRYRTSNIAEIVQRSHDDPNNRFSSPAQLLQFSREMVERSERQSRDLFLQLPSQPVMVEPLPAYQQGSGEIGRASCRERV